MLKISRQENRKKLAGFILTFVFIVGGIASSIFFVNISIADEYDEYDSYDRSDEYDEYDKDDESDDSSSKVEVKSNTYVNVAKSTQSVVLEDKDGDGLLDESDPHPEMPEIYIVVDDDRDGIVDSFEIE